MRRILGPLLIVLCVLAATSLRSSAESVKLRYLTAISVDEKGVGFRQPEAVACDDKEVIVGDTGRGRLLRYTVDGRDVKPAGEMVAPQLTAPIRLQLNSKQEVFALDGKERRILRFGSKGELKGYLTPEGVPAPTSIVPRSLAIDRNDNVYLLDVFGARVLVLDADGKYQGQLPFPKGYGFFSDIAVDTRGTVYVVDAIKTTVYALRKGDKEFVPLTKGLRSSLSFPTSMAIDSRGVIYVVDQHGGGIVLVGQDGSVVGRQLAMGWTDGFVYFPSQMCVNDKSQAFVADRGNSRVQVFSIVR